MESTGDFSHLLFSGKDIDELLQSAKGSKTLIATVKHALSQVNQLIQNGEVSRIEAYWTGIMAGIRLTGVRVAPEWLNDINQTVQSRILLLSLSMGNPEINVSLQQGVREVGL